MESQQTLKLVIDPPVVFPSPSVAGTFIEIGSNFFNTLIPMAKYGWGGVCVEPVPEYAQRIQCAPGVVVENSAIGPAPGTLEIYWIPLSAIVNNKLPQWALGIGSVSPNHPDIIKHGLQRYVVSAVVPCLTFDQLVNKHNIKEITLLKIDTEGFDAAILGSIDLGRYRPCCIVFEYKWVPEQDLEACIKRLQTFGYHLVFMDTENMTFVPV